MISTLDETHPNSEEKWDGENLTMFSPLIKAQTVIDETGVDFGFFMQCGGCMYEQFYGF